jgi:hypothetical protein
MADNEEADEHHKNIMILVVMLLLILYMIFEALKHKYHFSFGHEASLVCSVGLVISYCF